MELTPDKNTFRENEREKAKKIPSEKQIPDDQDVTKGRPAKGVDEHRFANNGFI